jgi:hypothetical protein
MILADAFADRAVGQYPISVATSLAIESALGVHPDIPVTRAPILQYPQLWLNVRTLYRNLIGALQKDAADRVLPGDLAEALGLEMEAIESLISVETQNKTEVVFYYSNYAGLEKKYKHAQLRRDTTAKQKEYTFLHNATADLLLKARGEDIRGFDLKLQPIGVPDALIVTHYAYDLVSYRGFGKLVLLESHTGAIKERAQWYTKYENGKELSMIPFREDFLQVFGDKETFRPMDIRMRRELIEIATRYNWTAVTTREKILYGIDQIQNPMYRVILKDMLLP